MKRPVIVWFRDDLRICDHRALNAAAATGAPLIALFILDDESAKAWKAGGASRWWLHHSLVSLEKSLREIGGQLVIQRGNTLEILRDLINAHNAKGLYFHRRYEPFERRLEEEIHREFADSIEIRRMKGRLLNEPEAIRTGAGEPFRVFTPFWKACLNRAEPESPEPTPTRLESPPKGIESLSIDDLDLTPSKPDWAGGLRETWRPGERGAHQRLEEFLDSGATRYHDDRDLPGRPGTSKLSPHLHFGEISPRQVWHAVRDHQGVESGATRGGDAFLRELGWREFCHHLLFHWPDIPDEPFNERFAGFPWRDDSKALEAWTRGQTGYPLVDAGMRELWHTGWMHNRVRMVAASFLVKHLLVPWQHGEAWFWDTLVDADLANNAGGWQWVAGCGADAAPYFRIFNPILQGRKFDPSGEYVRRWVPELSKLEDKYLHAPFEAGDKTLEKAGIRLGKDYPRPLVDHGAARERALDALKTIKA